MMKRQKLQTHFNASMIAIHPPRQLNQITQEVGGSTVKIDHSKEQTKMGQPMDLMTPFELLNRRGNCSVHFKAFWAFHRVHVLLA